MAIEVFNRYEKKYMLDKEQYEAVINKMSSHMEVDAYNKDNKFYMISNIYYDTPDDRLIRASIEKPAYKEKMRVRSYGVPGIDDIVFVEIKKKYSGIVNKRRTGIKLGDAYDYLDGKISKDDFLQLAKFKHPTHQISFHTIKALSCLEFLNAEEVHDEGQ